MLVEVLTAAADWTWILTILVGLFTMFMVKHVLTVRSLPPGPFPLPILGNILLFRGKGNKPKTVFNRLALQYKDIFTVWPGITPTIFVCSWKLCKEALITKRNDFSGRIIRNSTKLFMGSHNDVVFSDFGPCWEILRKILHSAVRKYAVSEKLSVLSTDVVDRAVEDMLKQNGNRVDAKKYIYLILYNIISSSAFGKRFELKDPEFISLREINDAVNEAFGVGLASDAIPALSWFYRDRENLIENLSNSLRTYVRGHYNKHKSTYKKGVVRDITDAVIAARQEAEEEGSDNLEFLNDGNLVMLLMDLFNAGTDTTITTLSWLLLFINYYPEIQKKMAEEIGENIGSRTPSQEDRHSCSYTYAVIFETLRMKPVIDFSLEHKSTCDTEIGGYKIPKDTSCLFHIASSHYDESNFKDPEQFKPERFLEPDGRFTSARIPGYMPFGLGRRACPGEKLALTDIFLIITRLLQRCTFVLEGGPENANLEPSQGDFINFPEQYHLIVKERQV